MQMASNAVFIKAVDWGYHNEQVEPGYKMEMVVGSIVGILVEEDDEKVVLAFQVFDDGGMRNLLSIPKRCIIERFDLEVTK